MLSWWSVQFCGFLLAELLLTVPPPCQAICKSGEHMPPCCMESAPLAIEHKFAYYLLRCVESASYGPQSLPGHASCTHRASDKNWHPGHHRADCVDCRPDTAPISPASSAAVSGDSSEGRRHRVSGFRTTESKTRAHRSLAENCVEPRNGKRSL